MQRCNLFPALQRAIARGPNAGQPRPLVDVLIDRATDLRQALIRIKNAGYSPIRIDLERAWPTIELEAHQDFARLVEEGIASYLSTRDGLYGQFKVDGVRFTWAERKH